MDLVTQLQAVLEERDTLSGEMRNILEVTGSNAMSKDAETQWKAHEVRFQELNTLKDLYEGQIQREREIAGGDTRTNATNTQITGAVDQREARARAYEESFDAYLRSEKDVNLSPDTLHTLTNHNEARERRDMVVGTPASGGYFAPPQWETKFLESLIQYSAIRKTRITILNTSNGVPIHWPVVLNRGDAEWVAESQEVDEVDDELGTTQLGAYAVARLTVVAKELIQDSAVDIDKFVRESASRKIGLAEDAKFVKGTGVGQPQGMVTGATPITTSSATQLKFDDIITVIYSLTDPYLANAEMLMNSKAVPALLSVKDTQGRYLWVPSVAAGRPDTIWGFNFFTDPFIDAPGTGKKPILFGDFAAGGIIRQVNGVEVQRLVERFATKRSIGYLADHRVDSKVVDENALVTALQP